MSRPDAGDTEYRKRRTLENDQPMPRPADRPTDGNCGTSADGSGAGSGVRLRANVML